MNKNPRPGPALSLPGSAIWTVTSASVVAEILLGLSTSTDGPGTAREVVHPRTCRACAAAAREAGEALDVLRIDGEAAADEGSYQ